MKKEKLSTQLGWAYFWITLIATLFGSYLKYMGDLKYSWWWVTAPVWGSLLLALAVVGLHFLFITILKLKPNEK